MLLPRDGCICSHCCHQVDPICSLHSLTSLLEVRKHLTELIPTWIRKLGERRQEEGQRCSRGSTGWMAESVCLQCCSHSGLCAGSLHCLLQPPLFLGSPGGGGWGSLAKSTSLEGKSALTLHNLRERKELISIAWNILPGFFQSGGLGLCTHFKATLLHSFAPLHPALYLGDICPEPWSSCLPVSPTLSDVIWLVSLYICLPWDRV